MTPQQWTGVAPPKTPAGYQKDFIRAYMTPEDVSARIARLARQYPNLVDVINLPNKTQGYRRDAAAYLGDPDTAAVFVESTQFGDQGWNGVQIKAVDPHAANSPLSASYADRVLTVSLATDAERRAQQHRRRRWRPSSRTKFASKFRSYAAAGSGRQDPAGVAGRGGMTDGLQADSSVPRAPWTVQALRIGVHRDGSRIGVLAYSQEHAREWATPLVTLEFAERLLANYRTDPEDATVAAQRRHLRRPGDQPGRRELLVQRRELPAQEHGRLVHRQPARPVLARLLGRGRQPQLRRRLDLRRVRRRESRLPQSTVFAVRTSCPSRRAATSSRSRPRIRTSSSR